MNIEAYQLMYYVADPKVFEEYGVTGNMTHLESGRAFCHVSLCNGMAYRAHLDERITAHCEESLLNYIEYVDGYAIKE